MGDSTDVLVIGAGPAGLFAAAELARHGVRARIVERTPRPHRQTRATALQPGTLEILHQARIGDRFLAAAEHLGYMRVYDPGLRCTSEIPFSGTGSRWEFQCSLPQWRTEQILTERIADFGGRVERGVTVVSEIARDDGVLVTTEDTDGRRRTLEASWVIGAGGAHSVTRRAMAETLAGSTYPGTALVADLRVSCGLPRDGSGLVGSPAGYVLLAPLPGGRWLSFLGTSARARSAHCAPGPAPLRSGPR
jgi:6-methylpretetramide 4-monooxygenase / 4-hydroxy-6-methylpretetramide 12a-monooxygenase